MPQTRSFRRRCALPALALLLCPLAGPLGASPLAEGSVKLDQADWTVADAMAWQDGEELEIVFSDVAFDRAAMTGDGALDVFDFLHHPGNLLALNLDPDGPTMCLDMTTRAGETTYSGSNCNSEFPPAISIRSRTGAEVAGSMEWESEGQHVRLRFDVPVEALAAAAAGGQPAAVAGQPLPADGGAPGKAVLAHYAALAAGDWERLKAISHPDRRRMMEESEQAGEHTQMFGFLRAFAPQDIRVTGGSVAGDEAQVTFEGTQQGAAVKGIADLVRWEGDWYFVGSVTE